MKFKGYELTRYYLAGSDSKELKNGNFKYIKPKAADIHHIGTEHIITGEQLPNSLTLKEAKDFIRMYVSLNAD